MKKIKLFLSGALLLGVIGFGSVITEARNIGELSAFRVTANGNDTQALKKLNGSNTIVNLSDTKGGKQVRVRTRVGSTDLGGTLMWTNTRKSYSDRSATNQYPYLRFSKAKSSDANFNIYGSWSPDSY